MAKETRISVRSEDVAWIAKRLARAGLTVLDTGKRVTTDRGVDAEAVLTVASFDGADQTEAPIEEPLLRP